MPQCGDLNESFSVSWAGAICNQQLHIYMSCGGLGCLKKNSTGQFFSKCAQGPGHILKLLGGSPVTGGYDSIMKLNDTWVAKGGIAGLQQL